MMINRIQLSKIKTQWELSKMKAAYIAAERAIVQDASLTGWDPKESAHDEIARTITDEFGNTTNLTVRDMKIIELQEQINEIEDTAIRLLEEEKYELVKEAKEIWEKLTYQLKNLKSR